MQSTNIPTKFPIPWAYAATAALIRLFGIPTPSQVATDAGAASLNDGFPPATALPTTAGGIPPSIADFNAIFQEITNHIRFLQAGGPIGYDATYQAQIGGYPAGSRLHGADGTSYWLSTVENNMTNPDTGGAGWKHVAVSDLGFTPVQQGGGRLQGPSLHKIMLGYDDVAGQPRMQVDGSDQGHMIRAQDVANIRPIIASQNVNLTAGTETLPATYTDVVTFTAPCNGYVDASAYLSVVVPAVGSNFANGVVFTFTGPGTNTPQNTGNSIGGASAAYATSEVSAGQTVIATFKVVVSVVHPMCQFQQDGLVRFTPAPT